MTLSDAIDARPPRGSSERTHLLEQLRSATVGIVEGDPPSLYADPERWSEPPFTTVGPAEAYLGRDLVLHSATGTTLALDADETDAPGLFAGLRLRYEALLKEYGAIALGVYFVLFVSSIAMFYVLIELGVEVTEPVGEVGKIGAAYAATKVLQPVRIVATLALTPLVARFIRRHTRSTD